MVIKKLNRDTNARKALVRSLALNLFINEKLETTLARARVVRPFAEKLITKARVNTVTSRRLLLKDMPNETVVTKLLTVIGPKIAGRPGGYLRIIKLGNRVGDGALLVRVEFVDAITPAKKEKKAIGKSTAEAKPEKTGVLETAKNLVKREPKIKVTRKSASGKKEEAK